MASRRPRSQRFLLPTILAAILAAEVTGLALARTLAAPATTAAVVAPALAASGAAAPVARDSVRDLAATPSSEQPTRTRGLAVRHLPIDLGSTRVARSSTSAAAAAVGHASSGTRAPSAGYHGTNRVWIPSLGISKGIQSFPCSRSRPPDAGVYRWGCSGRNNIYLLSHAWSTFEPLHDAYVSGRLRKGMTVVYADSASRVHTYAVIWWKVTAPTTAAKWAWASLSTPSMTLQTCVGSQSQYRLMVRLVQVG